jgi:hypothetical protein
VPEEPQDESEALAQSYKVLGEQKRSGMEIWKVNPKLFRELTYKIVVSPDVLHPRSEDLDRAMNLELYDRAIMNPMADQEAVYKDFLLGSYKSVKDPDDYVQQQQPGAQPGGAVSPMQQQPMQPGAQPSPMQSMMGKAPLPKLK